MLGRITSASDFGFRELAILFAAFLMALLILVPNKQMLDFAFGIWILSFGLGWRTIHITSQLSIHPSEILAYLICFLVFAASLIQHRSLDFKLPIPILLLMGFGAIGILTALSAGAQPDLIAAEAKVWFALIPTYFAVKWLINDRNAWERAATLSILVVTYVACLGMLDFFAPNVSRSLSGQAGIDTNYVAVDYAGYSFQRVGFILYGNFTAGFFIFTFFGLTLHRIIRNMRPKPAVALVYGTFASIQVFAMYLSGFRGLWYAAVIFTLIYALFQRRVWVLVAAFIIAVPSLPSEFGVRFQSIFNPDYADSSQYDRFQRLNGAFDLIGQAPLTGVGWSGSGYVHSDLAQIGADLGLPALAVFLFWIGTLLWQLFRLTRLGDWTAEYSRVLFATLSGLIVLFAGEGLIIWIQLTLPVWFLFALCYKLIELSASKPNERISSNSPAILTPQPSE